MTVKRYAMNEKESAEPWTYDLLFPSGDESALSSRFTYRKTTPVLTVKPACWPVFFLICFPQSERAAIRLSAGAGCAGQPIFIKTEQTTEQEVRP